MSTTIGHRNPRRVLQDSGLLAKKHFGQNFLVSPTMPRRIAVAGGACADDVVFEIGAGVGTLTRALAALAGRVVALEHDRELLPLLATEMVELPNVEVRAGNVLDVDWPALATELGGPPIIYGNLPYHLSTPILIALLEAPHAFRRACFLLQLEFAERLAAPPGHRDCGTLSAYAAVQMKTHIAFRVPPGSFHPAPRVDSAVLVLERLEAPVVDVGRPEVFRQMVRALFGQRRKTSRKALKAVFEDAEAALEHAGLAPERRGETFDIQELGALSRALCVHR